MEIKLFGKSLFEMKTNKGAFFLDQGSSHLKESKFLPDFYQLTSTPDISNYVIMSDPTTTNGSVAIPIKDKPGKDGDIHLTPKGIYQMKMLNDKEFELNLDPDYVDSQLNDFKEKLGLIKSEEYDMSRGVKEIASVVVRLENRKKYGQADGFFDDYPYAMTSKIEALVKAHDYLKIGQIASFLADLPKEAIQVMKDYNKATDKICGKQAVFYIIADKKDFEKKSIRRDPILLAQSPFGHFWQILGAWDKEMLFLEEL